MSKNHAILNRSPKLEFSSNFKFFLCGLVGEIFVYKTDISDFQNFGFAKKYFFFQKLTCFENFDFFLHFKNFQKTGIYALDHYIVHVHTKFQAHIIFGCHLITLKRCCPSDGSMVLTH